MTKGKLFALALSAYIVLSAPFLYRLFTLEPEKIVIVKTQKPVAREAQKISLPDYEELRTPILISAPKVEYQKPVHLPELKEPNIQPVKTEVTNQPIENSFTVEKL